MLDNYIDVGTREAFGSNSIGIKIQIAGSNLPDLEGKSIQRAVYNAISEIYEEIIAARIAEDPESAKRAAEDRAELIGLFDAPIYVEEIPNGYNNQAYFRHLPWFIVTTKFGRVKIGWRKRVIEIDWSDTKINLDADQLFPGEDVTRYKRGIHAWSLEKARHYIKTLFDAWGLQLTAEQLARV